MVKLTDEEKVETKERTEKGVADEEKAETKEDAEKRLTDEEKEMMKAAYNSPFDVELVVRYSDCYAAPISVNKILKGVTKKHSYKLLD